MGKTKSSFDYLFGETSLFVWKRRLDGGEVPSLPQIADIIEKNSDEVLPAWFIEHLCKRLRNPDKPKRGRPPSTKAYTTHIFAAYLYQVLLAEFQKERKSASPANRNRAKREPPPSERAARIVQGNFYKEMDWKAVLNLISSQKVPRIFMND
jgi:hypothetical protein